VRLSLETIQNVGTFASIALVTIAWSSTTDVTVGLLAQVRLALIAVLILSLLMLLFRQPWKLGHAAIGALMIGVLGFYSVLSLGIHAPSAPMTLSSHLVFILLTAAISSLFLLAPPNRKLITDSTVWMYVVFTFVILILTVFLGGLRFDGSLHFVYTFTTSDGSEITYSQGISKFYGLAAVLIAGLIAQPGQSPAHTAALGGLLVLFLLLSLLGGGRGDFVFALLLSLIRLGFIKLFALFCLMSFVSVVYQDFLYVQLANYAFLFGRFSLLTVTYGMRDLLLENSFSLLAQEPICLIFGCGIGYFQNYYGYQAGLFPHNVPVEFLISFGLLFFIPVFFLTLVGLWKIYIRETMSSHFGFIFLFFFLISLKSGTLLTSYILAGTGAYLVFSALFSSIRLTNKERHLIAFKRP
jgi:hypothetical protein